MRRIVLSLKPHNTASSWTEKCFSKAGAPEGGILKTDLSLISYWLLLSDICVTEIVLVVRVEISVKFSGFGQEHVYFRAPAAKGGTLSFVFLGRRDWAARLPSLAGRSYRGRSRFNTHDTPGRALARGEALLPLQHPWSVVFLGNQHARMSQESRNLLKRHSSQQVFDGKCVAQHVEVCGFRLSVLLKKELWVNLSRSGQDSGENLLPIGYLTLAFATAAPEKVLRIRRAPWRHTSQLVGYFRR